MTRDELIEVVRTAGKDIAEHAEDLVGVNTDRVIGIDIWIRSNLDGRPTYQVEREYAIVPPSWINS